MEEKKKLQELFTDIWELTKLYFIGEVTEEKWDAYAKDASARIKKYEDYPEIRQLFRNMVMSISHYGEKKK